MLWALVRANWKGISAVVLIAVLGIAIYQAGADSVRQEWELEKAQIANESLQAALRAQAVHVKLQEEKHENLAEIERLRKLHPYDWLRLPDCTDRKPATGLSTGTGQLYSRIQYGTVGASNGTTE